MLCECRKVKKAQRSSVIYLTHNGETRSVSEWARVTGISKQTIYSRLARRDASGESIPDEKVIFGTDPHNHARSEASEEADRQIERSLTVMEQKLEGILKDQIQAVMETFITDHLRPMLYAWYRSGKLNHPESKDAERRELLAQGLLPAACNEADETAMYNPAVDPNDDRQIFSNATYRQIREDVGDTEAESYLDPDFVDYAKSINGGVYTFYSDIVAQEQAQSSANEQREHDEQMARIAEDRKRREAEEIAARQADPWRYVKAIHWPIHSISQETKLKKRLPDNFPKQEDTIPLTQEEVNDFLILPWFKERSGEVFNGTDWIDNNINPDGSFTEAWGKLHVRGGVMRTMFDRIEAWNTSGLELRFDTHKAVGALGEFDFCTDHRITNHVLDVLYAEEWASRKKYAKGAEWDDVLHWLPARMKVWNQAWIEMRDSGIKVDPFYSVEVRRVLQAIALRASESPLRKAVEESLDFSF